MDSNFVTECLDSKLIPLGSENEVEAHDCLLRLRLHFLIRILLGDTIVVPQGWALDSISFFAVGSEIKQALDILKRGNFEDRHVADSVPFKMELHLPSANYADLLRDYLNRDNCHWSGLPVFRENRDARLLLTGELAQITRNGRFDPYAFASAAERVLENGRVASAWSDVARYFLEKPAGRTIRTQWTVNHYEVNLRQSLTALDDWEDDDEMNTEAIGQLKHFKASVERHPHLTASVSSLLAHVATEYDVDARLAIEHFSNFSQVHSVAQVTQSDSSAGSISYLSRNGILLGDRILRASFAECRPNGLLVEQNLTNSPELISLLKKADWIDVWKSVLLLAQNPSWKRMIAEFKSAKAVNERGLAESVFAKMENRLAKECPALALEISGVERIGLKLTDAGWSKLFGKAVGLGVGATVAAAFISIPVLAAAACIPAGCAGEAFLAPKIDHFKGGRLASKATIFRLMR